MASKSSVAALVGALALLVPSVAPAALPGNPFRDGPKFTDWHWRDEGRMARGDLPLQGARPAVVSFLASVPPSKWWPLHDPHGSTFDRLNVYLDRADQEGHWPAPVLGGRSQAVLSILRAGHRIRTLLTGAPAAAATAPVITALTDETLPKADCRRNTMPSSADWEAQLRQLVRAVGSHRVIFFVQSDATNANACLRGAARHRRIGLMRGKVQQLSALPNTAVYLDAAAADSMGPAEAAGLLREEGVEPGPRLRGQPHYDWTSSEVRYGQAVSRLLGGQPFVVNTALNGNGPLVPRNKTRWGNEVWCNPSGRSLGPLPLVDPAPHVDAFFWVGNPGHSDGACGDMPGSVHGPPVGTFWAPWANELVANSAHAPDFPNWMRGR